MNRLDIRFPKQLEADHSDGRIRETLSARTIKLWPGGVLDVPVIMMSDPLKKALQKGRLQGRILCGFEAISEKLDHEKKGIMDARNRTDAPYGERVSRLLLFSSDGAERLYRHIEYLLQAHIPRLIGCLLNIDSGALGYAVTGKDSRIKIVMAEHKETVSDLLRAIAGIHKETF